MTEEGLNEIVKRFDRDDEIADRELFSMAV